MPAENKQAAPFQREDRYIVIKHSDLGKVPVAYRSHLVDPMLSLLSHSPRRECLVIESDWPEHEPAWQMIERRMTGQPPVTAAEELEAVWYWRGKHTQAIRERDALQLLLNDRDEQNHSLEQRRQAEQAACQAAERRVDDLKQLLKSMTSNYARVLESGYDRITFLGGDCDSVEKMLADNPDYARALAALNPIKQ